MHAVKHVHSVRYLKLVVSHKCHKVNIRPHKHSSGITELGTISLMKVVQKLSQEKCPFSGLTIVLAIDVAINSTNLSFRQLIQLLIEIR